MTVKLLRNKLEFSPTSRKGFRTAIRGGTSLHGEQTLLGDYGTAAYRIHTCLGALYASKPYGKLDLRIHKIRSLLSSAMRRLSILVADLAPDVGAQFCQWLHGHHTVSVHSGAEAANALSLLQFDMAIMDMGISDVSGPELIRVAMQQQPRMRLLAVLNEFGWEEDDSLLAMENGADCVALKPMSEGGLRAAVKACWGKTRATGGCGPHLKTMLAEDRALSAPEFS